MILDCSLALAWFLKDEKDPSFDKIRSQVELGRVRAVVPRIWAYEVHSSLAIKVRQQRCTWEEAREHLEVLSALPFDMQCCAFDYQPAFPVEVFSLLEKHNLNKAREDCINFFDAQYLALAIEKDLPLASLDEPLVHAAVAEGVQLVISVEDVQRWKANKKANWKKP